MTNAITAISETAIAATGESSAVEPPVPGSPSPFVTPIRIDTVAQMLSPGRLVELFDFDATSIGGVFYRFCSSFKESGNITWQGNVYTPLPIMAEGFEVSGKGTLPTPTLKISNVALLASTMINEIGDPLGAKITRWTTFDRFLDDGVDADPDQHFLPQVFVIERKKMQTRVYVEFELSAAIDQQGRMLPGRQIVRDYCSHRYRRYDSGEAEFDYTKATCPWAGSDESEGGTETPYFTSMGEETDNPAADVCGKKLSDCKLRFAALGLALPFRGFPGVGRIRRQ